MIGDIQSATDTVSSASREIAAGTTDLSQRTEQQASALEETAASMEQMTASVRGNSESAIRTVTVTRTTKDRADKGGGIVEEAIHAMGRIEASSKKIADIIQVIDEIVFQTNLLALNAAVEAARAGEAGKGFAVVAAEVRSLAGRSAEASKEIKHLIKASTQEVVTGSNLVNQAGSMLLEIVKDISVVVESIQEISNASSEQANGIGEINSAISQMDQMTQQNAALVEQNTAAATSLVDQARELAVLVSFFKLSGEQQRQAQVPVSAPEAQAVVAQPAIKTFVKKPAAVAHQPAAALPAARPVSVAASNANEDDWKEF
jgi:methyl-accepting chemotaxis protein